MTYAIPWHAVFGLAMQDVLQHDAREQGVVRGFLNGLEPLVA